MALKYIGSVSQHFLAMINTWRISTHSSPIQNFLMQVILKTCISEESARMVQEFDNYFDFTIWKLNRRNTEISKEIQLESQQLQLYKDQHQELVQHISQLDRLIRAQSDYIQYKEKQIIDNTRTIQQLRRNPNNK